MITKTCTKCGKEKNLSEFHKRASNEIGYRSHCKKCISNYDKGKHINNKEHNNERCRKWRVKNRKYHIKQVRKWQTENKEKANATWRKKNTKRRRNFGYIPLNNKFPGSVGHHISKDLVVFIPEGLHKSIPHRYDDPISMGKINGLALEYMMPEVG